MKTANPGLTNLKNFMEEGVYRPTMRGIFVDMVTEYSPPKIYITMCTFKPLKSISISFLTLFLCYIPISSIQTMKLILLQSICGIMII